MAVLAGGVSAAGAQPQIVRFELMQAVDDLIDGDAQSKQLSYALLMGAKDAAVVPALDAYRNGLLERFPDGRLVIYLPREENAAGQRLFPMVDAFSLEPLLNDDRSPAYSENLGPAMLRPPDEDRQMIAELSAALSIFHVDLSRRRDAILGAGNRADASLLEDLRAQLSAAGELSTVLRESIARIELVHGSPDERLAAVGILGGLGTLRGAGDLREELGKALEGSDLPMADAIQGALDRIESYQKKVRLLHHTFAGLSLASILVLLALGLSIIFGLMRVINLAHGEFMMAGAYVTYVVAECFKAYLPAGAFDYFFILALPLAFLIAGLIGWFCEVTVIQYLYGRPIETLLATWGISLLLIQTARVLFGDTASLTPPRWLQGGWEVAPDLVFPLNRVFIIIFCAVCVAGVYFLVQKTRFGLLLRATTQDRPVAAVLGVRTRWVDGLTFGFGAGLAGLAGATVPLFDKLNPNMGQSYVVDSFMVVVVGGVGKLAGAITAGTAIGFTTKYIEPWLEAVYGKLAVLALIILFLQWRPSGLFPHKGRQAED